MGADKLEGLHDPHGFCHGTTNGEAIDGRVHDHSFRTDQKKPSKGNPFILHEGSVTPCRHFIQVGKQWIVEATAEAAVLPLCIHPGFVNINGVHRNAKDLTIDFGEFFCRRREVEHFCGTDKGEIEWIEKEKDPLLSEI
jgi:hypothetical protein